MVGGLSIEGPELIGMHMHESFTFHGYSTNELLFERSTSSQDLST